MKEAIVKDSNAEYHAHGKEIISASGLKMIAKKSVAHYLNGTEVKESDAMRLGTAVHARISEPDVYYGEVRELPDFKLTTKAGREERDSFLEENQGKTVIRNGEAQIVEAIFQNYQHHPLAPKLVHNSKIEYSHYGKIQGIDIRTRPDGYNLNNRVIWDIKTCQDNSPKAFKSDIYKYKYHVQVAFNCEALKAITGLNFNAKDFRFLAFETNYPFSCEVYALPEDLIELGYKEMKKAWDEWKLYKETGVILGYQTADHAPDGALIL
jgi:hypothetical protein